MESTNVNYDNIVNVIYSEIRELIEALELLKKVHDEINCMKLINGTVISEQTSKDIANYFDKYNSN